METNAIMLNQQENTGVCSKCEDKDNELTPGDLEQQEAFQYVLKRTSKCNIHRRITHIQLMVLRSFPKDLMCAASATSASFCNVQTILSLVKIKVECLSIHSAFTIEMLGSKELLAFPTTIPSPSSVYLLILQIPSPH